MKIEPQKLTLRKEIADAVRALSPDYCRAADDQICRHVAASAPFQKARTVLCYVGTQREIDTRSLLETILHAGKTLALPLCIKKVSWRHGRFVRSTNCAPVLLAYWNRSRRLCLYHRNRSILQSFRAVREMREANALGMAVDTMTGIFCKRIAQQCSYAGMRFGGRRSPLKRTICAWSISYPSAGAYIVVILRCVPTKTTAF